MPRCRSLVAPLVAALLGPPLAAQPAAPAPAALDRVEPAVRQEFDRRFADLAGLEGRTESSPGELAAAHGEIARLFHAYDLASEAETHYRRAHELAPAEYRWAYLLAIVVQFSGQLDEAAGLLERALALEPERHAARLRLAEIRVDQGQLGTAELLFRRAASEHAACPRAAAGLGRIALARGQFEEAVRLLEGVLATAPAAPGVHYSLGMAYRGLGDLEKARQHLAAKQPEVGSCDPLLAEVQALPRGETQRTLSGTRLVKGGQLEQGLQALEQALAIDPESVEARANLAFALSRLGRLEEAEREYREVLRRDPDLIQSLTGLGQVLVRQGRAEEGEAQLRAALAVEPSSWLARLTLGSVLEGRGALDEAAAQYRAARETDPSRAIAWASEARSLIGLARWAEARSVLEQGQRLHPDHTSLTYLLARLLAGCPQAELRDGARALGLAVPLAESQPEAHLLATVALALAELGRCDEARGWQRDAIARAAFDGVRAAVERLEGRLQELERGFPCRAELAGPEELFPGLAEAISLEDLATPQELGTAAAEGDG